MQVTEAIRDFSVPADPRRVQQAIARLQALPAFYPTVQKALRLLEDPLSSTSHLQQVISSDQAVAARVLKLANSAYFGFYSQVETISLAVSLIGREKIASLLHRFLAEELIHMLSGKKPAASQIREMSLATAAGARALAERMVRSDQEELLIAGLLHNVGELVLLSQFRDDYEEMLRLAERTTRVEAEVAIFGVESRLVGKWLLAAWNFPAVLPTIVEHWADPWAVHFSNAPLASIAIVHAARYLADCWIAHQKPEDVFNSFSARLLSTLEVDRHFLTDLYAQLPGEIEQLKSHLA